MSKKTSPLKSISFFLSSVLLILAVRWIGFEPYVIPSGSMIPTLLINDHILVTKYDFGIRLPFSNIWLGGVKLPNRGDVVVFRSVEKDDFYLIKRVVGLPGDQIEIGENGDLIVNGVPYKRIEKNGATDWDEQDLTDSPEQFKFYLEETGMASHWVIYDGSAFSQAEPVHIVPPGHLFMMGDNRDRSRDSRFWGDLPVENLLGKAQFVWLSCSKTLSGINIICDPTHIRWQRFFHKIK